MRPPRDRQRERLGRNILRTHARRLAESAPSSLRVRCLAQARPTHTAALNSLGAVAVLALAVVGGALAFNAAEPGAALRARLVADHLLYPTTSAASTRVDPDSCARTWKASHGWEIAVPGGDALGLTVVGIDRCQLAPEDVAHVVYRSGDGRVMSLFIQPGASAATPASTTWLGQTTACWESCGRAYTLVSGAGVERTVRVATAFRRELNAREEK